MIKLKNSLKVILLILLALAFIPLFTGASCDKTMETPLSDEDLASLRYYREPTIDDNFEDNSVYVSLKSAFKDLEEISFKDIKIVERVSKILYIDLYTKEIPYSKNGVIPLGKAKYHHMFDIVFEEHSKEKVLKACKLLNSLDMVLSAEPNYILEYEDFLMPEDPDRFYQWNFKDNGCNLQQAWDITTGSTDVKVGIMENNIDMSHEDLEGRVFKGNFTPSSKANKEHGTAVAGVLGAIHNDRGIAGVAQCTMYLLDKYDIPGSLQYAKENDIKIINASFGETYNKKHYDAIAAYDGLFIAAAGNSHNDNDVNKIYPASYDLPNIISVGAIDMYGERAVAIDNSAGSNYGKTTVDLFAPGKDVYTTLPNDDYKWKSGTSFAAPHVAGVAALIYSKYPYLSASEVKAAILNNTRDNDKVKDLCVTGGTLDAYNALLNADNYHTKSYQSIDANSHNVICSECGKYLQTDSHTKSYQHSNNNQHEVTCSDCGYYFGTEPYTEYYQYRNENQHDVICSECKTISNNSITIRIEAHTFKPYVSGNKNNKLTGKICTGCYYILYDNGFGSIITKDEDEK